MTHSEATIHLLKLAVRNIDSKQKDPIDRADMLLAASKIAAFHGDQVFADQCSSTAALIREAEHCQLQLIKLAN